MPRASMRPRQIAAENVRRDHAYGAAVARFNEAAANCRGKRRNGETLMHDQFAGFNEAAANCRGKRQRR